MSEYLYSIHGVGLRLATDSPAIASAVYTLLRHFQRETLEGPIALEILFNAVHSRAEIPITVSPSAEVLISQTGKTAGDLLHSEWKFAYYRDGDRKIADFHDQGLLLLDDERGRMEGYLVEPDVMHLDVRAGFFHFGLTELLKRHGLYTVHATALEKGGRGLLIPGSNGGGKTTCCISLLRAGYRCLSDDHPLLRENGAGLELLSFPAKIDVTEKTIAFFPELRDANGHLYQGVQKRYFYIEDMYPHAKADICDPVLIIFPRITDTPKSCVEPLPKSRALEEILPQGLLVFDKDIARRQFQTFSRLVEKAACYRLYFGEDILDLPQLVDHLLSV